MANGTGPSAPCCFGRAPYPKQWKLTNLTAPANSACENCDSWTPAAQYILDQQMADPCALWENNNLNDGPDCNGVETIDFRLDASLADNGKIDRAMSAIDFCSSSDVIDPTCPISSATSNTFMICSLFFGLAVTIVAVVAVAAGLTEPVGFRQ